MEIQPLGMLLASIRKLIPNLMIARLKELGITYTFDQLVVLLVVRYSHEKQIVQQDIAACLNKDKSLVMRIVDVLEKDGLLVRLTDPNDRRKNIIHVTGKGVELTDIFYKEEQQLTKELMGGLSEEEIQNFYKVISHVRAKAHEFES